MAEAIATKRKRFTRALGAFTTSSQISLAHSNSTSSTTPDKRPATAAAAFDEARARASKRLRHSASGSSIISNATVLPQIRTATKSQSNTPPNFAPWSHDAFLARLKTFSSVVLWHPKPEAISEVEWAKRGWICVEVNTVGCSGGCERRVVVDLAPRKKPVGVDVEELEDTEKLDPEDEEETSAAFEAAITTRYHDQIIDGHSESCLWRKAGCKDDIYRLQVIRPSVWQPALAKRYQSLLEIGSQIEHVVPKRTRLDDGTTIEPEKLFADLPDQLLSSTMPESRSATSVKALHLALYGWRGSKDSGNPLLHCDACFQRIGLWMYQPDYKSTRPSQDEDNNDNDNENTNDAASLDPTELHRDHCPWRNAASQKAPGNLSGLNASQILQRVVSTSAREHRRRSDEQAQALNRASHAEDDPLDPTDEQSPEVSREETARQDKERESRLRKLKNLFNIKRRSAKVAGSKIVVK